MTVITKFSLEKLTTLSSITACCMYTGTIVTCCLREGRLDTASAFMDKEPMLQILFFTVLVLTAIGSVANVLSREHNIQISILLLMISIWCTTCAIFISVSQFRLAHMLSISTGSLSMYIFTFYAHSWRFACLMTLNLIYLIVCYQSTDHVAVAEFLFFELVILRVLFNTIPDRICEIQVSGYSYTCVS